MTMLIERVLWTGLVGGIVSGVAAAALSRVENKRAAPAINAVSHIAWGGPPPADSGPARRNLIVGSGLHLGAALFWAAVFEPIFGAAARRSRTAAWIGAAATAAGAYCTDYHVVPQRLRPGMEAFLSKRSLQGVYAALAIGFVLAARSSRGAIARVGAAPTMQRDLGRVAGSAHGRHTARPGPAVSRPD